MDQKRESVKRWLSIFRIAAITGIVLYVGSDGLVRSGALDSYQAFESLGRVVKKAIVAKKSLHVDDVLPRQKGKTEDVTWPR